MRTASGAEYLVPKKLKDAALIAHRFIDRIRGFCVDVEIVGSIRRERDLVNDVDIVAIPKVTKEVRGWFDVQEEVNRLAERIDELIEDDVLRPRVKKDGKTMVGTKVAFVEFEGFPIDVYYATPETWGGLMLIRTGSTEHNILMVSKAKERGWFLHASGEGLFDAREGGKRLDDGTERSFFDRLNMPYREPREREIP